MRIYVVAEFSEQRDDKIRSTVMEHIEMHCRQAGYPSKASAALCRQVTADLRSAVRKARHITDVASSEVGCC